MHIIPAIDLLDGEVVRLKKGDYDQKTVYSDDPVSFANEFKEAGFNHIHVVDLNGAREGVFVNLKKISEIITQTGLSVQSGGGVRTYEDAETLLEAGVSKVVCSSMPVKNPEGWQKLVELNDGRHAILGLDIKDGKMAYAGWKETADGDPFEFLRKLSSQGLKEILCTDISRDGMLTGVNQDLYKHIKNEFPDIYIIASGGVADKSDFEKLMENKIQAVVVGRAFYENFVTLEDMLEAHSSAG